MKYFSSKLWRDINSPDSTTREKANSQWEENAAKYRDSFEIIKHKIPNHVLTVIDRMNGFHDYTISGFSAVENSRMGYVCSLVLRSGERKFCLQMSGIKSIRIDIPSSQDCLRDGLTWGYHEIATTDAKTIQLSILCDIENELSSEFEDIALNN